MAATPSVAVVGGGIIGCATAHELAKRGCPVTLLVAPDGMPVLGPWPDVAGLFVATGHFRNGILLAPITAATMARCIVDGETPSSITPFLPQRLVS